MEENSGLKEKIGLWEKFAYGFGDLASNLVLVLTGTYITFFYTDALGLDAAIIGTLILISRLFDGVTDVLMGYVMDKTKSRHGKARAWMLWLAIPFGISTVLLFTVPNIGIVGKYIYVFISYNVTTSLLYTAINIPYGALNSLMTRDQNQRAAINIFRMALAQIGSIAITALTLPLVNGLGGSTSQGSWVILSIFYGALATALFYICFFSTKERVDLIKGEDRNIGFKKTIFLLLKNKCFLLICAIWVIFALGMSLGMGVGVYYAKYVLGNEALFGFLAMVQTGVGLIAMIAICFPLIKKYGKRNIALVGSIIGVFGQCLIIVAPTNLSWLYFVMVIKGLGMAPIMATLFAMIADAIEYGEWKTGTRVEGMLYSATTFGAKVGSGVGIAVAMGILGAVGYNGDLAVQSVAATSAISFLYVYAPIVFLAAIPFVYWAYDLDKIYPKIMQDLAMKKNIG